MIINAILHHDRCSLETALQDVALSICKMREAFKLIHGKCFDWIAALVNSNQKSHNKIYINATINPYFITSR